MALKGLRSDTTLNGAVGVVTGYDKKRARYFVDLSLQRTEVNVRACNLRLLPTKAGIVQDITISQGISNPNVVKNVGVVVHTADCTSLSPEGGTADVWKQFPFAAPFKGRVAARTDAGLATFANEETCARPGSALVFSPVDDEDSVMGQPQGRAVSSSVAFLMTRWLPGEPCCMPTLPTGPCDSAHARAEWFAHSLQELESLLPPGAESVAFPYRGWVCHPVRGLGPIPHSNR